MGELTARIRFPASVLKVEDGVMTCRAIRGARVVELPHDGSKVGDQIEVAVPVALNGRQPKIGPHLVER